MRKYHYDEWEKNFTEAFKLYVLEEERAKREFKDVNLVKEIMDFLHSDGTVKD